MPGRNGAPTRSLGLTAFAAACTAAHRLRSPTGEQHAREMPMREFTFIGVALLRRDDRVRRRTARSPDRADGAEPAAAAEPVRRVGRRWARWRCAASFAVLLTGPAADNRVVAIAAPSAATRPPTSPRGWWASRWLLEAFEVEGGQEAKAFGRVMSNLARDGDRLVLRRRICRRPRRERDVRHEPAHRQARLAMGVTRALRRSS